MIPYIALAIALLAAWHLHPVLFELLDLAGSLFADTRMAHSVRSRATGAPVPLADDMDPFGIEIAPSDDGTTRTIELPQACRF